MTYAKTRSFGLTTPIIWSLLCFVVVSASAQQAAIEDSLEVDKINNLTSFGNIIVFEAPSDKFIPIVLQTHNGQLRFGVQDNYYSLPDGTYVNHQSKSAYQSADKKMQAVLHGQQGILELLKMRHMEEIYDDMDRNLFAKYGNNMYQKDKNSYNAQQHLFKLANALSSIKEMYRYFCNTKVEDCSVKAADHDYFHRNIRNVRSWGGKEASEFQQLRGYTSYVTENFEDLQAWSKTILASGREKGYYVVNVFLDAYNFENKGYWLRSASFKSDGFLIRYNDLEPINANERKLAHPNGIEILYPISPDEAEQFSEKSRSIYMVFEVEVSIKGMQHEGSDQLDVGFTLNNPIISLYSDDSLSIKIGEIDITTMTSKTR